MTENSDKKSRLTENILLLILVTVIAGAFALVINSFMVFVAVTHKVVHSRIKNWILAHPPKMDDDLEDDERSPAWRFVVQVARQLANGVRRHPVPVANAAAGPIALTVGVLVMTGLLRVASTGRTGIAMVGLVLIATTTADGIRHGFKRFIGVTVVCAVALIGFLVYLFVLYIKAENQ